MTKRLLLLILCAGALSSCTRSHREVWEDTKTCSRYFGKGMRSLFGRHNDNREYAGLYETWNEDPGYVALPGSEQCRDLSMEDAQMASRESPGDPGSKIPGIDGFLRPMGKLAAIFSNVYFPLDNYSVQSENMQTLKEVADYLARHPNTYVFVEGHADERGAAAYNLALGSKRSNSVRAFLIQNGASPDQVFTISYGKERPVAMEHNEISWQKNRRAEFKIYER